MNLLSIQNISKYYEGSSILKEFSLEISSGEVVLINGDNGTGKSTLFNIITGVELPDVGAIYFKQNNITNYNALAVSRLGLVCLHQSPRVFKNLTVLDNLLCAIPFQKDSGFLEQFFTSKKIQSLEANYKAKALHILKEFKVDHLQNELAGTLSYGQQKLVALSMIGMTDADLILLDEPFAGLNATMIAEVKKTIQYFQKEEKTIVVIEHRIEEAITVCDRHLTLKEGKLLENKNMEVWQK